VSVRRVSPTGKKEEDAEEEDPQEAVEDRPVRDGGTGCIVSSALPAHTNCIYRSPFTVDLRPGGCREEGFRRPEEAARATGAA